MQPQHCAAVFDEILDDSRVLLGQLKSPFAPERQVFFVVEHLPAQGVESKHVGRIELRYGLLHVGGDHAFDTKFGHQLRKCRGGIFELVVNPANEHDVAHDRWPQSRGNCFNSVWITPPSTTSSWPLT